MAGKVLFTVNSQDLYGEETLREASRQGEEIAQTLNSSGRLPPGVEFVFHGVVTTSDEALAAHKREAEGFIAHLTWNKTFSPAQMHTEGLLWTKASRKPFGVMHTQFFPTIPYDTLDQDYMNNNQDAHGGREYCHGLRQVGLPFAPFTGDWRKPEYQARIGRWVQQALAEGGAAVGATEDSRQVPFGDRERSLARTAVSNARSIRCVRFGGKMRQVHVTDGNPSAARVDHGWEVLDFGVGDLVDAVARVSRDETAALLRDWSRRLDMSCIAADPIKWEGIIDQVRLYLAIRAILRESRASAFTTSFQQTHGLRALPGLAVQMLMADGIGFGPEGDWKTACLGRLIHLALQAKGSGVAGWWTLMEDYIYDFDEEVILGSHMLEISTAAAGSKPVADVMQLTIGDSGYPARAIFDVKPDRAVNLCLLDMRSHWELVALPVQVIKGTPTPKLPTARAVYRPVKGSFTEAIDRCLLAGVCHHTVQASGLESPEIAALAASMSHTELRMLA
jgi:L-arabinose isomerase